MTNTAVVEVLTAEVRVLMVGSRQITLSVARQLDEVDEDEITPFGRIRTGEKPDFAEFDLIEVIGSHNGSLARAASRCYRYRCDTYKGSSGLATINGRQAEYLRCEQKEYHQPHFYASVGERHAEFAALPLIVLAGLR